MMSDERWQQLKNDPKHKFLRSSTNTMVPVWDMNEVVEIAAEMDRLRTELACATVTRAELAQSEDAAEAIRTENAALTARLAEAEDIAKDLQSSAVILSREYLDAVGRQKRDDDAIQGWPKSRWVKALNASDRLNAFLQPTPPTAEGETT